MGEKLCGRCRIVKPLDCFRISQGRALWACRECKRQYDQERHQLRKSTETWKQSHRRSTSRQQKRKVAELMDNYVIRRLRQEGIDSPTPELITAKRAVMRVSRLLKESVQ